MKSKSKSNKYNRPSFDEVFMTIARIWEKRATCLRRKVGAVVAIENNTISTGYNGAPRGTKHCAEIGCLRQKLKIPSGQRLELCRAVHAEQNAILNAARYGKSVNGATLYVTTSPCSICAKEIINSGIIRIVYDGDYPNPIAMKMLKEARIKVERYSGTKSQDYFKLFP